MLKAAGGFVTVVAAFALIGAGVQMARNTEGYQVKTAALGEVAGAPVTVIDDDPGSAAPTPPVLTSEDASLSPALQSSGTTPPGGGLGGVGGGGTGDDGSGGGDDPSGPEVPPELDPIVGLVDDITGATTAALDPTSETDAGLIDSATEPLGL